MSIISDFSELTDRITSVSERLNNNSQNIESSVQSILNNIATNNTLQIFNKYSEEFDKHSIKSEQDLWQTTSGHFDKLKQEQQEAIKYASERIRKFQTHIKHKDQHLDNTLDGNTDILSIKYNALDRVGIYIPGGNAPLLSTVMMTVIPAQIAGVKDIIITSPPPTHSYILAVCEYLGISQVLGLGGIQAVGALAYGIANILEPVDMICGPGNAYVTEAKKQVYGTVGIDALYGPSELLIIADKNNNPRTIAYDLMSQLEHASGWESTVLLTTDRQLAEQVEDILPELITAHTQSERIQQTWSKFGIIGITQDMNQAIQLNNIFAPEHLELKVQDPAQYINNIKHAGAIFLGNACEAFGDYVAGPSHCLPTGRSARYSSGLSVNNFLKRSSIVNLSATDDLKNHTATLAFMESLDMHAQSALNQ